MNRFDVNARRHWHSLMSLLIAAGLTACAAAPVAEDAGTPALEPAAAAPAAPDVDTPATADEVPPSTNETPVPTCQPVEVKPKPRPKPKPLPKPAPPQPQTASTVKEVPQNQVIDADVKPLKDAVTSILGKKVQGPNGEDLGRVVDVLADESGRVRVAIIDFGGFLGVGNRRIAVDWPLLRFKPEDPDKSLILSLSREKLQGAPEYRDSAHPQALLVPLPVDKAAVPAEGKQ